MAQSSAHGHMDISEQKGTFNAFLTTTVWCSGLIAQGLALLTLAFAIGAGWWAGLAALVVLGVALGLAFRMSGVYWAVQVVLWVLLGVGGLIVSAI